MFHTICDVTKVHIKPEPQLYLKGVLSRLPDHQHNKSMCVGILLPKRFFFFFLCKQSDSNAQNVYDLTDENRQAEKSSC